MRRPRRQSRDYQFEILNTKDRVRSQINDPTEELPRPHERTPKGSKGLVSPNDESAIAGEGGGELGGDEGFWDAPNEGENEETQDGEEGPGSFDGRFSTIGPTGHLKVDEEDQRKKG